MTPFSEAAFWVDLRQTYEKEGVAAWDGKVPFHASSNAFLAEACARVIETFQVEAHERGDGRLLVLELGAGHGQFSHYLLTRLARRLDAVGAPFVYVMSDLAAENVDFWETHSALASYLDRGLLDFAIVDVESKAATATRRQAIPIGSGVRHEGPVVVVANYLFDSLRCEYLRAKDGRMERAWLPKDPEAQMARQDGAFLQPSVEFFPLEPGEIDDPAGLLAQLDPKDASLQDLSGFLFPVGCFEALNRFRAASTEATLLLVNDKGRARPVAQVPEPKPALAQHFTLSVDVPFDFLRQWTEAHGGRSVVTPSALPIQNAGFLFTEGAQGYPLTLREMQCRFADHPTGALFSLFHAMRGPISTADMRAMIACLTLCQWDPFVFEQLAPGLIDHLEAGASDTALVADLIDGLQQVDAQYYAHPGGGDAIGAVAAILQALGHHHAAFAHCQRSRAEFGDLIETRMRAGQCLFALGEYALAQSWFESVVADDPENFTAIGYVARCREANAND